MASRQSVGGLCAAVLVLLCGPARAQLPLLWEVEGTNVGSYWRHIAVGNHGTQVVGNLDGGSSTTSLCLTGATTPGGTPLVWTSHSNAVTRQPMVASSARSDVHALFAFEQVASGWEWRPRLSVRRSSSAEPLFQYLADPVLQANGTPPAGVHLDALGEHCVIWWFSPGVLEGYWRLFRTQDGVLLHGGTLPSLGVPRGAVASEDLGTLVVITNFGLIYLDPLIGSVVSTTPNQGLPNGHGAISTDGRRFVQANTQGGVDFFERTGAQFVFRRTVGADPAYAVHSVALSGDGRYLAVGSYEIQQQRHLRLRLRDLSSVGDPVVLADDYVGSGSLITYVTDIELDHAGRLAVVGTTGDAANTISELVVYERHSGTGYQRRALDLPGSVYDVALAPDTRTVVVASSQGHMHSGQQQRATLRAFDLGADLRAVGTPTLGDTSYMDATAPPGTRSVLLGSHSLLPLAEPFRNMGLISLRDPVVMGSVTANAAGRARHALALPNDPSLIGTSTYFQSVRFEPRRLSECVVAISALP